YSGSNSRFRMGSGSPRYARTRQMRRSYPAGGRGLAPTRIGLARTESGGPDEAVQLRRCGARLPVGDETRGRGRALRRDQLPRPRCAWDGRGSPRGHGPHSRQDHRGLDADRARGERTALQKRLERLGVRPELEALTCDPRVAVVAPGVAIPAVA